jgi:sugar lactone lactonase YvrE
VTALVQAIPVWTFYVTKEAGQRSYSGKVKDDGALSELNLIAYQRRASLAQDKADNLYVAADKIYVYGPARDLIEVIRVPERPTHRVCGGNGHRTLFILSHSSIFSVRTRTEGR